MSESQHHTLVCSVLFLDIEGYSTKSVTEQLAVKQQFNDLLLGALRHVAPDDRIILDTGDGAAVSFLSDPEDSLFAAMNLRDAIAASAPQLRVRIGINLGPVRMLKDINGQVNIIGDGINDAQRVMSFCEPGKILVSRSYFEVVSRLSDDYARLFVFDGTRTDKHVREHAVYAIGASTPEPPRVFSTSVESAPTAARSAPPPPATEPPQMAQAAQAPAAPPRGGHNNWVAVAVIMAVFALLGGGAFWLWQGRAPQAVPAAPPERPAEPKPEPPLPPPEQPKVVSPEKPAERAPAPARPAAAPQVPVPEKPVERKPAPAAEAAPAKPARSPVGDEAVPDWLVEMRKELAVCRKQGILQRGVCTEKVRWIYCQPSNWNKVEECRVKNDPVNP